MRPQYHLGATPDMQYLHLQFEAHGKLIQLLRRDQQEITAPPRGITPREVTRILLKDWPNYRRNKILLSIFPSACFLLITIGTPISDSFDLLLLVVVLLQIPMALIILFHISWNGKRIAQLLNHGLVCPVRVIKVLDREMEVLDEDDRGIWKIKMRLAIEHPEGSYEQELTLSSSMLKEIQAGDEMCLLVSAQNKKVAWLIEIADRQSHS